VPQTVRIVAPTRRGAELRSGSPVLLRGLPILAYGGRGEAISPERTLPKEAPRSMRCQTPGRPAVSRETRPLPPLNIPCSPSWAWSVGSIPSSRT
jgi:hypothetical protein